MQKTIWTRTALAIALCAPVLAQSGGASLAEVAQKSREQQKHVITNDDFPSASAPDSGGTAARHEDAGAASAAASPENKKDAGNAAAAKENKPEDTAELKKKIESYKQQRDVWKQSAEKYEQKLSSETDEFRREVYQRAMENDRHNAVLFQAKINEIESQLANQQPSSSSKSDAVKPSADHAGTAGSHP